MRPADDTAGTARPGNGAAMTEGATQLLRAALATGGGVGWGMGLLAAWVVKRRCLRDSGCWLFRLPGNYVHVWVSFVVKR